MFARLEREGREQKEMEEQSEVRSVSTMDETSEDSKQQWALLDNEDDFESTESKLESDSVSMSFEVVEHHLPGMVYNYVDPDID